MLHEDRNESMVGRIHDHLQTLGIHLPVVTVSAGNYVPWIRMGPLVAVSGQLPLAEGLLYHAGRVGVDLSLEDGYAAARLCGLNLIAHLQVACDGDLDRVRQVVRLGGFVNCSTDFTNQPTVINGASDLMIAVFGQIGYHTRTVVGVLALPLGAAVEIEGLFEII